MNLDGCDSTCHFEQVLRATSLTLESTVDAVCTSNAFGQAFTATVLGQLQSALDNTVQDGSTSILFKMVGLDDLSGTNDGALSVGVMKGLPVAGTPYNGHADVDWWYTVDPNSIDAARQPKAVLPGTIASGALSAGPGVAAVPIVLGGVPAALQMSSLRVSAALGSSSTPLLSAGAVPPGHLASEHLDPGLTSFETASVGTMCGSISAASLAQIPVPAALAAGGASACGMGYTTTTNSLLDVMVGGCTVLGFLTAVNKTQPDQIVPTMTQPGAGGPYKLTLDGTHHVNACKDSANATVDLTQCLNAAAYSSYFDFTADRVIAK
jgi:hypothetical protein